MISKSADVVWPKGSFTATFGLWQREWFYITDPHGTRWVASPAFQSGPSPQLTSWINKGLDWGSLDEVQILQRRIRDLIKKDINLIKVIQVPVGSCHASADLSVCGSSIRKDREPFNASSAQRLKGCINYSSGHETGVQTPQRTHASTATIRIPW